MGWRGQDNRDLANERDYKTLHGRERNLLARSLFVFAVLAFIVFWVAASMK